MTENQLIKKTAGSPVNEPETGMPQESVQTKTDDSSSEISALKAELEQMKGILMSLESNNKGVNNQGISTAAFTSPNFALENVKQVVAEDFRKIDRLTAMGRINAAQGANLKQGILQKAFGSVNMQGASSPNASADIMGDSFSEFEKSNPGFFSNEARKPLKEYIQQAFDSVSPQELIKIADLVKLIEDAAVKSFEKSKKIDESARLTNNEAKKRLASAVLSASKSHGAHGRTFTREEIGKMTPDEFSKYESEIMQQLREGKIK